MAYPRKNEEQAFDHLRLHHFFRRRARHRCQRGPMVAC